MAASIPIDDNKCMRFEGSAECFDISNYVTSTSLYVEIYNVKTLTLPSFGCLQLLSISNDNMDQLVIPPGLNTLSKLHLDNSRIQCIVFPNKHAIPIDTIYLNNVLIYSLDITNISKTLMSLTFIDVDIYDITGLETCNVLIKLELSDCRKLRKLNIPESLCDLCVYHCPLLGRELTLPKHLANVNEMIMIRANCTCLIIQKNVSQLYECVNILDRTIVKNIAIPATTLILNRGGFLLIKADYAILQLCLVKMWV